LIALADFVSQHNFWVRWKRLSRKGNDNGEVNEGGSTHLNPTQLLKAIAFAADKHRDQRRKDAKASPYINHPIAVSTVLAAETDVSDEITLIPAALHDTVEDTQTTFGELEEHFGSEVADLVREVTDDKSLKNTERKRLQIVHAPHLSIRAKQLKIADKICNVRDVTDTPPADWPLKRRRDSRTFIRIDSGVPSFHAIDILKQNHRIGRYMIGALGAMLSLQSL
jgi:guanosine-3',5'-bis(diphosphate) 3'-pyrophosphohydrolase